MRAKQLHVGKRAREDAVLARRTPAAGGAVDGGIVDPEAVQDWAECPRAGSGAWVLGCGRGQANERGCLQCAAVGICAVCMQVQEGLV